jgi:SAM-dependent methyltransferase
MSETVSYEGKDLEAVADMPRYHDWIMEHFRPHLRGNAAEFGAGLGTISERILPSVSSLDLVEPSPNLVGQLRRRFADEPKVHVFAETLETRIEQGEPGTYDAVVMVNVLEHIEDDALALHGLNRLLKPGGRLLVFVPAMPFLYSRLDELVGHHRRYTRPALAGRLAHAGFRVRQARYMDVLGILPWWLVNTLGGSTAFDPRAVRLYDTVGIPVTRLAERLVPPPVGKNVVAVAEKPA